MVEGKDIVVSNDSKWQIVARKKGNNVKKPISMESTELEEGEIASQDLLPLPKGDICQKVGLLLVNDGSGCLAYSSDPGYMSISSGYLAGTTSDEEVDGDNMAEIPHPEEEVEPPLNQGEADEEQGDRTTEEECLWQMNQNPMPPCSLTMTWTLMCRLLGSWILS
ncbi:hypothetical protein AMTR_s00030p00193490 [Amborella trichopoda]|uniref:Uncharacterized protein n=1 Tax=Amborella trichopoda TaxID=13333 RepID=U5D1L4_AMBTC|nr:hypothetical protein AMTR_s00030p00193490 [Amborella trichopoda]